MKLALIDDYRPAVVTGNGVVDLSSALPVIAALPTRCG